MADKEYQVVFRGETVSSKSRDEVKTNLAALFKTNVVRIERLFSGKPMVVKQGVDREEGERYRILMEKAGAVCELVPMGAETPPPPPPPAAKVPPQKTDTAKPDEQTGPGKTSGAAKPGLKQRAVAMRDKVKAVQAGDLNQAMGTISEKVREIDAEQTGRKVASMVEGASAAVKAEFKKGGAAALKKNKVVWAAVGACGLALVAIVLMFTGGAKPMPIESSVFSKFEKQYNRDVRKIDLAAARTTTLIGKAREVIDDMGYDFDQTLLLWLLRSDLVESRGGMDIYTGILVEPVAVAVAADLSGIGDLIAPETRDIFKRTADLPQGVGLSPIRMIKACPATGQRLRQADMLEVLKQHGVAINPDQPDLTIADTFFGLERAGLIKIHRRWDDDVQYSDIEILDMESMTAFEGKLVFMEELRKKMAVN